MLASPYWTCAGVGGARKDDDLDRARRPPQRSARAVGQQQDGLVNVSHAVGSQHRLIPLDQEDLVGSRYVPVINDDKLVPGDLR